MKLEGVPSVEPVMVIALFDKQICLECGTALSEKTRHKCYTKSRAAGYTSNSITCVACLVRKHIGHFPVFVRRIRGHSLDEVRVNLCSVCLDGKQLIERRVG